MTKIIHIISFDVPLPANYGGVIDVFYKIKALKEIGVQVILHAYQYGRPTAPELDEICYKVYYYRRRTYINPFVGAMPYIVKTRNTRDLLENLLLDDHPILFEGIHTTYYLHHSQLSNRLKMVRMHNIEHHYYKHLELSEPNFFKKYFFRTESEKLRRYQQILKYAQVIFAISPNDHSYLSKRFENVVYLPAFHSNDGLSISEYTEPFILYHGNLAVSENYTAAKTLIVQVFSKLQIPCVVAGNNPPSELIELIAAYDHIELQSDVSTEQLHNLISKAHINVLYTHQNTGIKLKLLNVLYRGSFVVVNDLMVAGTGLEEACIITKTTHEMIEKIKSLMELKMEKHHITQREKLLNDNFKNQTSAEIIHQCIEQMVSALSETSFSRP